MFFVMVFSRAEPSEFRVEAAIKARSKRHAALLASYFAGEEGGAVAFSRMKHSATAAGKLEILARIGDVPDDHALLCWFGNVRTLSRLGIKRVAPPKLAVLGRKH